jgi:hypothetical protein
MSARLLALASMKLAHAIEKKTLVNGVTGFATALIQLANRFL